MHKLCLRRTVPPALVYICQRRVGFELGYMRHTALQAGSASRLAGWLADRQLGKLARLIPCLALAFGQLVQISARSARILP